MSRWTDAFSNHAFHTDWANLEQQLERAEVRPDTNLEGVQEWARLRKLLAVVGEVIKSLDPELVNPSLLGNLQGGAQAILGEVSNYFGNGNVGHLRNANNNADGMASALAQQMPMIPSGSTKAALTKAATAYQETMESYARDYAQKTASMLLASEHRVFLLDQKVEASNESISKLDTRIGAMEAQLPTQLSSYNATFQASEATRADKFDKWSEAYVARSEDNFVQTASKAAAALDVLFSYRDQAGKVLGSVVDTAQAGAYATYATEEKRSANLFRRLAIVMMALAALVLFLPEVAHAIKEASTYTVDWQKALARLPFSLVLFAPALYLAKESSRHRTNEVANRRREHILTTIGPYLALLDAKRAEEIKAEVAKSIFADSLPITEDKTSETGNLLAQLSNLMAAAKQLK